MNTRIQATKTLVEILQNKKSLSDTLEKITPQDSLSKALAFGVMRYYFQLDAILKQLLQKPIKTNEKIIEVLLLIGLYQIIYLAVPDYAAVNETVDAAKQLQKTWAVKLINAVLRNFLRQKTQLLSSIVTHAHPAWLVNKIKQAYPEQWQQILQENNQQAPMTLRVNQQQISRDEYIKKLQQTKKTAVSQQGIILSKPLKIAELPGFAQGLVSVQDEAAQLAPHFLNLTPGLTVLDACAAPGGKTCHLLETVPNLHLTAIEKNPKRLLKIQENLSRLKLHGQLICADILSVKTWWQSELFDRILLDAPCSGTGVIRRHPDIKYLRLPSDILENTKLQNQMLTCLWPLLKPNGLLLYATCSILPEENHLLIKNFCREQATVDLQFEKQILPGENQMDGFYYALLKKRSSITY